MREDLINEKFFNYLEPYLVKLRMVIGADFIVFGSAPLYLLGVVPFSGILNDLDIFVKDLGSIPADAQRVTFHGDQGKRLYKIRIDDLNIDIGTTWPGFEKFAEQIISNPLVVNGFNFANLDAIESWKQEMVKRYDRQKDKDYLLEIHKYKDKFH